MKHLSSFFLVVLIVIFIDQSSKFISSSFTHITTNRGVSFQFLANFSSLALVVFLITFLLVLGILLRSYCQKYPLATGLFFGGAVSNILDRLFFGGVRDWFPLPFLDIKNNIADIAIISGMLLLFFQEVIVKKIKTGIS